MTQVELSIATDINIARLESGCYNPTVETLYLLALELDIKVPDLMKDIEKEL